MRRLKCPYLRNPKREQRQASDHVCKSHSAMLDYKDYKVKRIGSGSTASVYVLTHLVSGDQTAVKVIKCTCQSGSKSLNAAEKEATIHKALRHPNIVRLSHYVITSSHCILAMEYLPGGDLCDYISGCPITEKKALYYFRQVVSAVEFMHANGVVHRDIKPDNVALDVKQDVCKLIDFGFACPVHTPLSRNAGTVSYMAPESLEAKDGVYGNLKAVDVWAAGILLFTLLTGAFPWTMACPTCLGYNDFLTRGFGSRGWPSGFSYPLNRLFAMMLCHNPCERCCIQDIKKYIECDYFVQYLDTLDSDSCIQECAEVKEKSCKTDQNVRSPTLV
eukprot:Nk52_evm3s255 gene=Nk52_evmTU3s255